MTDNPKYHKPRKFLKMPQISGGKKELIKFIKENLRYPEEAKESRIEGDVIVKYKVSDKGEVFDPEIIKGLGYGCDEEAIRLVRMILYNPVKNRGARVTAHQKVKIPFRLPQEKKTQSVKVVYNVHEQEKPSSESAKPKEDPPAESGYTITIDLNTGSASYGETKKG